MSTEPTTEAVTNKSDAQLDAEAQRPREDLDRAIKDHRALYVDDCLVPRLTSRQPPLTRYEQGDEGQRTGVDNEYVYELGAVVGMPMSGSMIRRLSDHPGEQYPWVTAYARLRTWCRREHAFHRGEDLPKWRGSLCYEAVKVVIVWGSREPKWTVERAAYFLRYDALESVLRGALAKMDEIMKDSMARAEQREKQDAGVFQVGETLGGPHRPMYGCECRRCSEAA